MKHLAALVEKHLASLVGRNRTTAKVGAHAAPDSNQTIHRRTPRTVIAPPVDDALYIDCPDPTAEDTFRDKYISLGQKLARQERWEDLIKEIEHADKHRHMTPGTMPVADLLAFGARADVIQAAEHALMHGQPAKGAPLLVGIEALEHVMAELPNEYVVAAIVAQTHMDIAWAWRGNGWDTDVPKRNRAAFEAHFDRANDIVASFCALSLDSPLLASTCCALMAGTNNNCERIADKYQMLIDLNPNNPRSMRAMGNHLLPRWHGCYADLELEARRTAARTAEIWGAGGYTWVQFDAITGDDEACTNLDLEFFTDGLRDILQRRPDAYTANLLAAYCSNAIGQTYSGNDSADQVRAGIAECAHWIVREHLTELHPMIWAHAAHGFDNNLRIASTSRFAASGRDDAMRIIMNLFSSEIAAGKRIVFTDSGPVAQT